MKVSLGLPTHRVDRWQEFLTATAISEMARGAEAAGFDAVFVTDHPFPGDAWLAHGGHHTMDPWVALSVAATATSTLRLQTNLLIAAYRNPFLTAKAASSLDVASGGRLILGIGAGYLEPEFDALGVDFEERNELADEAIVAMKQAWSGRSVAMTGRNFDAPGNTMLPVPVQTPHPPIWVGGNSRRAIRRAVEMADGWVPMPNPARSAGRRRTPALETLEDLTEKVTFAHDHAAAVGRTLPLEIVFMPLGLDMSSPDISAGGFDGRAVVDHMAQLASVGVSYLCVALAAESRASFLSAVERFGVEVLGSVVPGIQVLERD